MELAITSYEDHRLLRIAEREIAASEGGEIAMSDEYQRRALREEILGGVAGLMVVAVVFLMVTKPGL